MNTVRKSDEPWRARLAPIKYAVTRQKATERGFTGRSRDHRAAGVDRCPGCGTAPFASDAELESGCGRSSHYDEPIDPTDVRERHARGHDPRPGHVLEGGPPPTGLRAGIDSESLTFKSRTTDGTRGTA